MTDKPGAIVKEGVKKSEADEMKTKLETAGATVELSKRQLKSPALAGLLSLKI